MISLSSLTKNDITDEILRRKKAIDDIVYYAGYIDVPGKPVEADEDEQDIFQNIETTTAAHHKLILHKIEETSKTPYGRLMIFCPPGSAKTTYASVVFPSRYLGEGPRRNVIVASYGDDLARKIGRRTRAIIRQNAYKALYNASLVKESQSAQNFILTNESEYMACGILAGVTGNRAHGLLIDDPIKGREQADSPTIRNKTWEAYQDDLLPRLIPGGWICLIQTRWHQDDPAGRILPDNWRGESGKILCQDGMVWDVVCLQARCEVDNDPLGRVQGEYLWPEWFDEKHWKQFEAIPRTWAALFQQMPILKDGMMFETDKFVIIKAMPGPEQIIKSVRYWDKAATEGGGANSAGTLMHKLVDKTYLVSDCKAGHWSAAKRNRIMKQTAQIDGHDVAIWTEQEPGSGGKESAEATIRELAGFKVFADRVTGSKETRAEPYSIQVEAGNVKILAGPWNKEFIDEHEVFPLGKLKDRVDSASGGFNQLARDRMAGVVI